MALFWNSLGHAQVKIISLQNGKRRLNTKIPSTRESKSSSFLLLARIILALAKKRGDYPLTCAALWSGMKIMHNGILNDGMKSYLGVTKAQIDRFLVSGWDYTEPRLRLLQLVSKFPLTSDGAHQLAEFRRQMEKVRDRSFELVRSTIYEHPSYPIFQHVGQAFRNQVTSRNPFVLHILAGSPIQPCRICDVGCGSGILLGDVLEQVPNAQGMGIDISNQLLQHATRVLGAWGLGQRARFTQADIRSLPFEVETFDFILGMEVLEHLPDPVNGLHELKRVLAPAGWLVTSIPVKDGAPFHLHIFNSVDEVRQMFMSVGFTIKKQQINQTAPGVPDVLIAAQKI